MKGSENTRNFENKDTSMVDINDADNTRNNGKDHASLTHSFSQMNVDAPNELEAQRQITGRQRSRSTLIFNDEDEIPPYTDHQEHGGSSISDSDIDSDSYENESDTYMQEGVPLQPQPSSGREQQQPPEEVQPPSQQQSQNNVMIPIDITWQQGGQKAYVTGSFTGWRKMIGLVPVPGQPGILHVKLQLPPGTHRFRFIVDNELRFSDYLPTATDQMGNFVNYLEVAPKQEDIAPEKTDNGGTWLNNDQKNDQEAQQRKTPLYKEEQLKPDSGNSTTRKEPMSARSRIALEIEREPDDMGNGFSRFHGEALLKPKVEYTQDIPAVFTDPTVMEQYYLTLDQQQNNHQNMAWLTPPQLPPHLENVILNSYSNSQGQNNENTSGALPIPNHVILNHLATSSIKHNTLCVASIVRYKQKYVTQILYAPLQ